MTIRILKTYTDNNDLQARLVECENGTPKLEVVSSLANAEIYLQGAHMTYFAPIGDSNWLWLSPCAVFESGKAIRGGIPICWPWFGKNLSDKTLPQHGFARTSPFQLQQIDLQPDKQVRITLQLERTDESIRLWPYDASLTVEYLIGKYLTVSMHTHNQSTDSIPLTQAIHTYLHTSNIHQSSIAGLHQAHYFDQLSQREQIETATEMVCQDETDRIYYPDNNRLIFKTPEREFSLEQSGGDSTVVWNPWIEKAKEMSDFPNQEYQSMLCIEAANTSKKKQLEAGEKHSLTQIIYARPLRDSI